MRFAPTHRLVWLAALLGVPAATVWSGGGNAVVGGGVCGLVALVALVDLVAGRGRLAGVEVAVPEMVRAGKGKAFEIEVGWTLPAKRGGRFRLGLPLPEAVFGREGRVSDERFEAGKGQVVSTWEGKATRRGRYVVDEAYIESATGMGLWVWRKRCAVAMEVRVYPDLAGERRGLSAVFLRRGGLGMQAQRQVGKGRDFEQLREYARGDDYADIYWKATAKRGYPVTKMFQIERTQEVYVVVDHSRLSAREVATDASGLAVTQLERFLVAALSMGLVAETQGDLFGVVSFADQVDRFIRARNGKGHYDVCRDALYNLQPAPVSPDFEELVIFLRTRLTRRALLVVLTDLSDALTAESFVEDIRLVTRQHLVMVVGLRPPAARPLFSAADAESAEDVYRDLGGHYLWGELNELGKVLGRDGAAFVLPDRDALTSEVVTRYLNIKSRQLL